jgi:hypothetical protein
MAHPPSFAGKAPFALWALALVLAAGALASLWLNWPGELSPDSVWQLQQGRAGLYNAWHPPVMAWMLGLFDRLAPGAPGFIVLDAALGYGGLMAIGALSPRPRPLAALLAALLAAGLCASPLLLIYQGDVWKDVLFADASLAGFAALAWCARAWDRPARRIGLAVLAFALFALAALSRQNGLITPVWGAGALAILAWRAGAGRPGRLRVAIGLGLAALALCLAVVAAAGLALERRSDGDPAQARQLAWLQVWDLAGAARLDPGFAASLHDETAQARFVRESAAPAYSPERVDTLLPLPGADAAVEDAGAEAAARWFDLIRRRPDLYLRVRFGDFGQLLATPRLMACRPLFIGLDGPQPMLDALKLAPRNWGKILAARRYSLAFVGTPVLSHLVYAGLALALIALAVRDLARAPAPADRIVLIALLGAALSFAASFLVIGVACDYRYLYFLDLAAMAGLLHRAAVGLRRPD